MTTILGGRYRLGEALGVGGMGQVFAATDERLDRPVAVKVLRDDLARDPESRARFEREARAAARLCHPNVVTVFDTGVAGRHGSHESFLVMERCSGATLLDEMQTGPLTLSRLRRVANDVAAALAAAHAAGVLHRDVKPGNVLVATDGMLKVADFGIAKTLDTDDAPTVGLGFGTPAYSAPERLRGEPATAAADVWSLGVLLYEAATGERPLAGAHRPLRDLRPDVDARFAAVVEQMLHPDPTRRPGDGLAVLQALEAAGAARAPAPRTLPLGATAPLAATAPLVATAPRVAVRPTPKKAPRRPGSRARVVVPALAVLAVALLLGLVAAGTGDGSGPAPAATSRPATTTTILPSTTTTAAPTTSVAPAAVTVKPGPPAEPPGKAKGHGKG